MKIMARHVAHLLGLPLITVASYGISIYGYVRQTIDRVRR